MMLSESQSYILHFPLYDWSESLKQTVIFQFHIYYVLGNPLYVILFLHRMGNIMPPMVEVIGIL